MNEKQLEIVKFHGDELEVVEFDGEGWVSFPSLLRPFVKRADSVATMLEGWARTRVARVPSRTGALDGRGGGVQETIVVHRDDAPLVIARLDRRGMDEEMKERHTLYLKECAKVLAEYFTRGVAVNPRAPLDPVLARILEGQNRIAEQLAGGVQAAQTEARQAASTATRAEETAKQAAEDAKVARAMADQAVLLAGSKGLLDAISDSTAPGRATETPDGAVVRKAPDGYKAMRAVARDYSLPRSGEGASLVSRIAEALGIFDDPKFYFVQDVVIGGRVKNQHRMYSPAALELLDKPLRAAQGVMVGLGYVATTGGAMRPIRTGTKSRKWTVAQMYDAAIATSAPPPDGQQGSLFEKAS